MRAGQSWLVVNSVILSSFAEGRIRLFGAEIFNNLVVAIVAPEPGWKQRIPTGYKPRQYAVFACFSPKISTFFAFVWFMKGAVLRQISIRQRVSFQVMSKFSCNLPDVYLSHFGK